jgi:hypothetical protein
MAVKTITALEAKILPVTKITVEAHDDVPEKTYVLVLDFNALARAEDATGLDLSKPQNWQNLKPAQLTKICWAAFDRYHPEVTLREVGQMLAPAQWAELFIMLFEQCHPGTLERVEQARVLAEQTPGKDQPDTAKIV